MRLGALPAGIVGALLLFGATAPVCAQNVAAGRNKHGYCANCHGIEGRSFKPNYPVLAGLPERYLLAQLNDFKGGQRRDPNMQTVIAQLSAQDMRDLAAFFASVQSTYFFTEQDFRFYLHWLRLLSSKHRCAVHAYALMTNHIHVLLAPADPAGARG